MLCGFRTWRQYTGLLGPGKTIDQEEYDGNRDRGADHPVQIAAGAMGNRLAAIDFVLALDSLGRHFECPGKKQGDGKTDRQHQENDLHDPIWRADVVDDQVGDLRQQPGHDHVGETNAEYVAAFEFCEEISH
ncbi:hypothetical protein MnTg04_01752 [bacterium MnTg04]|nr:hypothetical protein MnTg04_01752 [bacterium MnTg04]